jgi:hypothetical protein
MDLKTAILTSTEGDVIGWNQSRGLYEIYRAEDGAPDDVSPEFLIMGKITLPWAITKTAVAELHSLLSVENSDV